MVMKRTALFLTLLIWAALAVNVGFAESGKSTGNLYMRTAMSGSSLNISWIYLGNDGVIVKNPVAGANPIDLAKEKAKNAANTGTYTLQGDKLHIKWSNGKTAQWRVEKAGNKLKGMDGGIVTQPAAMPAGYKLEGNYASSAVAPNVSNSSTFTFKKDGTFQLKSSGTVTTSEVASMASSQNSSTYNIAGNTLTLKMADGTVEKSLINILDFAGDKYLIINQKRYPLAK